ncbi:MAG: hypothetical protein WKF40_05715 [Thermoleophilaceae bacterium]
METLCNTPAIIEKGADWFKATVRGQVHRHQAGVGVRATSSARGNYEIELGISIRDIIYGIAGGPPEGREVKGFFPGGSSAPVLTADSLDLPTPSRRWPRPARCWAQARSSWSMTPSRSCRWRCAKVLPARVVRQVRALPRGHQLDGQDARADRAGRGHPDGPGDHERVQENIMGNCLRAR